MGSLALQPIQAEVKPLRKKKGYNWRFDDEDVESWKEKANAAKVTLSEWVRRKCNGDASSLTAAAEKQGMDAAWLADKFFRILNDEKTYPRDKLSALKALVAARGEATEGSSTKNVVNLQTPRALVIVGGDPQALNRMLKQELPPATNAE